MRLFIAIDLPKEALDELLRLQTELKTQDLKASFSKSFHLTLKFLGEVEEDKVFGIIERLKKIEFQPFSLKLSEIGVFPSKSYIKVVWAGLENSNELNHLYKHIKNALPEYKDDHGEFIPHLTLARVSFVKDKKAFVEKLEKTKLKKIGFEAKAFILYKSNLTPKGPVYEKVEQFR